MSEKPLSRRKAAKLLERFNHPDGCDCEVCQYRNAVAEVERTKQTRRKTEPAKIPKRRRCENCGEWFELNPKINTPARIAKGKGQRFCKNACRWEFARNGGQSYARIKLLIEVEVRKNVKHAVAEFQRTVADLRKQMAIFETWMKQQEYRSAIEHSRAQRQVLFDAPQSPAS